MTLVRDGFGLALVFHALSLVLAAVLVAQVEPAGAGRWAVVGALAIARLALLVPLTPNGIGVQEGALGILFLQLGLPPEAAIAATLLGRLSLLATAAIGTIAIVANQRERRTTAHVRVRAATDG